MNALAGHLASQINVTYASKARGIDSTQKDLRLKDVSGKNLGSFSAAIVAVPPKQARPLLVESSKLLEQVQSVKMLPTWAVMAAFDQSLDLHLDGVFVHDSPLSWVARNNSKPLRSDQECWVLHGSREWSALHLEENEEEITEVFLQAFFEAIGFESIPSVFVKAHRWRFGLAENPLEVGCLGAPSLGWGLAATGVKCRELKAHS